MLKSADPSEKGLTTLLLPAIRRNAGRESSPGGDPVARPVESRCSLRPSREAPPMNQSIRVLFGLASTGMVLATSIVVRADDPPRPADPGQSRERTSFQTHARWDPRLQIRSDVAICYGIDASLP